MNLTDNYRLTTCKQVKKSPTGLDALLYRMVGRFKGRHGDLVRLRVVGRHLAGEIGTPHRDGKRNRHPVDATAA